jgi:hypothetical protein
MIKLNIEELKNEVLEESTSYLERVKDDLDSKYSNGNAIGLPIYLRRALSLESAVKHNIISKINELTKIDKGKRVPYNEDWYSGKVIDYTTDGNNAILTIMVDWGSLPNQYMAIVNNFFGSHEPYKTIQGICEYISLMAKIPANELRASDFFNIQRVTQYGK